MRKEEEKAEDYIKDLLNIPDKYGVECIIGLGYPAEEKKPYEEGDLEYSKLHYNSYKK